MKSAARLFGLIIALHLFSCKAGKNKAMERQEQIKEELTKINSLLKDKAFTISMADVLERAYQGTSGQNAVVGLASADATKLIIKKYKEEKLAINLAGFYAVECGIGVLMEYKGQTPCYWLSAILSNQLDSGDLLLLNRFANATWKAGQPFQSIDRINKPNFVSANFLSQEEIQKDIHQINAAAKVLSDSMQYLQKAPKEEQLKKISMLLQDKQFAYTMASQTEAAYYKGEGQPVPAFISPEEDTTTIQKKELEEKVASNTAGFYALECGVSYLATVKEKLPSETLEAIIRNTIDANDKLLLERFANATWKAGQPFRSLDRITRDNFVPASFLSKEDTAKDWVQIQAAAKKLLSVL
jgi:hypothetical protein